MFSTPIETNSFLFDNYGKVELKTDKKDLTVQLCRSEKLSNQIIYNVSDLKQRKSVSDRSVWFISKKSSTPTSIEDSDVVAWIFIEDGRVDGKVVYEKRINGEDKDVSFCIYKIIPSTPEKTGCNSYYSGMSNTFYFRFIPANLECLNYQVPDVQVSKFKKFKAAVNKKINDFFYNTDMFIEKVDKKLFNGRFTKLFRDEREQDDVSGEIERVNVSSGKQEELASP